VRRLALGLVVLAIAGCATVPPHEVEVLPEPTDASLPEAWHASGRVAFAAGDDGGSASLAWTQDAVDSRVSLRGPLGVGALEIVASGAALEVTDGSGLRLDADAARALLRERLGAELPLAELRYWMLGRPAPFAPAELRDSPTAPLRVIEQSGWNVSYASFTRRDAHVLPTRIDARSGELRLRFVIDDWQLD
jgi:outer membrane lipoprotein LolB